MTDTDSTENADLRERLEAEGVQYALAGYTDMHGGSTAKVVPMPHLERMMN